MMKDNILSFIGATLITAAIAGILSSGYFLLVRDDNLLATGDFFRLLPEFIEIPSRSIQQFFIPDYSGILSFTIFACIFFVPVFLVFHILYYMGLKRWLSCRDNSGESIVYFVYLLVLIMFVTINLVLRKDFLRGQFLTWKGMGIQILLVGAGMFILKLIHREFRNKHNLFWDWLGGFFQSRILQVMAGLVLLIIIFPLWFRVRIPSPGKGGHNVILVSIDTLRADHLGVYGYPGATSPVLDALSRKGLTFIQTMAQAPWTIPSHMSMFTSLYPSAHGCEDVMNVLPGAIPTLAELLQKKGYETAGVVSHITVNGKYGFDRGFTFYHDTDSLLYHPASLVSRAALSCLKKFSKTPFFMFVHYFDPHLPYLPPDPYTRIFTDGPVNKLIPMTAGFYREGSLPAGFTRDTLRQLVAQYDGEIRFTDQCLVPLIEYMTEQNLWADTLLVITSDHGEEFMEHGNLGHQSTLFNPQIHVPLIIVAPDSFLPAGLVSSLAESIDIFPTILEFTGVETSSPHQGTSLTQPLDDPDNHNMYAFSELHFAGNNFQAIRVNDDKLVIRDNIPGTVFPGDKQFFDLNGDPREKEPVTATAQTDQEMNLEFLMGFVKKQTIDLRNTLLGHGAQEKLDLDNKTRERLKSLGYLE